LIRVPWSTPFAIAAEAPREIIKYTTTEERLSPLIVAQVDFGQTVG
jgi:hypothetical protein